MIDNDRTQPRPPVTGPDRTDPAVPAPRATVFSALGLIANPFPDDPGAGPFIATAAQATVLDALRHWWNEAGTGQLAIVTGEAGSGRTRTLIEFRAVVAGNNGTRVAVLPDPASRRSDAQLLKDAIAAFEAEPLARTGLELQQEFRRRITGIAESGQRPLLLVDGANLAGSQLEILRGLLTGSPLGVVLFGDSDLVDRVARRRSLAAFVTYTGMIEPFTVKETTRLIGDRIAHANGDRNLLEPDALRAIANLAGGNPRAIVRLTHAALLETIARGQTRVDHAAVQQAALIANSAPAHRTNEEEEGDLVIQTRIQLPGLDEVNPASGGGAR
jgi:type II secretory pathway predicted ATPase ExeA